MSKTIYEGSRQFRPLSAWAYCGYGLLFLIPVVGWLFLVIFSFSKSNLNRRSFARSYWCMLLITVIFFAGVGFFSHSKAPQTLADVFYTVKSRIASILPATFKNDSPLLFSSTTASSTINTTSASFKEVMDSYEAFFDDYVDFMKKYTNSSNTSGMLADYLQWLNQYVDVMEKLEAYNEDDLTDDEWAYYTKVMLRITQKLSTIQ